MEKFLFNTIVKLVKADNIKFKVSSIEDLIKAKKQIKLKENKTYMILKY